MEIVTLKPKRRAFILEIRDLREHQQDQTQNNEKMLLIFDLG